MRDHPAFRHLPLDLPAHQLQGHRPHGGLLNQNIEFRKEMEGSVRSYFKIFVTTTRHTQSFEKYEARLKAIGMRVPKSIKKKIQDYLQQERTDS